VPGQLAKWAKLPGEKGSVVTSLTGCSEGFHRGRAAVMGGGQESSIPSNAHQRPVQQKATAEPASGVGGKAEREATLSRKTCLSKPEGPRVFGAARFCSLYCHG